MLIFKITKKVEDLILYRKISLDVVWWSYSGKKIPNSAIKEEDGLKYVIRSRAGYTDKIYIKILKQNDHYSIIDNYEAKELIELGYDEEKVSSLKSILLYDEILLETSS